MTLRTPSRDNTLQRGDNSQSNSLILSTLIFCSSTVHRTGTGTGVDCWHLNKNNKEHTAVTMSSYNSLLSLYDLTVGELNILVTRLDLAIH